EGNHESADAGRGLVRGNRGLATRIGGGDRGGWRLAVEDESRFARRSVGVRIADAITRKETGSRRLAGECEEAAREEARSLDGAAEAVLTGGEQQADQRVCEYAGAV